MAEEVVRKLFDKYAGEKGYLTEGEFKDMIEKEVEDLEIRECFKQKIVSRCPTIFTQRDVNTDGQLSFDEFKACKRLIAKLTEKK